MLFLGKNLSSFAGDGEVVAIYGLASPAAQA